MTLEQLEKAKKLDKTICRLTDILDNLKKLHVYLPEEYAEHIHLQSNLHVISDRIALAAMYVNLSPFIENLRRELEIALTEAKKNLDNL